MRYSFPFITCGLFICYLGILTLKGVVFQVTACWFGSTLLGVGMGYLAKNPRVFMKSPSGRIPSITWLLFLPYFTLNWLTLALTATLTREPAFNQIRENLYLGRRPLPWEAKHLRRKGFTTILDATAEFPGWLGDPDQYEYLNIPVLDGTSPNQDALERAVLWLKQRERKGNILIHCALGHSRSALFAACYLIAGDPNTTPAEVMLILSSSRKGVGLSPEQESALERFAGIRRK